MIRILIIDDQKLVLESLKMLFESEPQFKVVGTAMDGKQGIEIVKKLKPDVAIIDLTIPHKDGIETTYFITKNYPQTKVVIYTSSQRKMLDRAILTGAKGYLLKSCPFIDLVDAVNAVHRNNIYIGTGTIDRVLLSSANSQELKIKHINLWLAKKIVAWWRDCTPVKTSIAETIIKDLGFDEEGLVQMRKYLCQQGDKSGTLTKEIEIQVEKLFTQIKISAKPERKLKEDRQRILNILSESNISGKLYRKTLQVNLKFLQISVSDRFGEKIAALNLQVSPVPLLAFFQSLQQYLSDREKLLIEERNNNLDKRKSALSSFDYVLKSKSKPLVKLDICKKAIIFAYQCRIEAEVYSLVAQIIGKAIRQLKETISCLNRTNSFLDESVRLLEELHQTNIPVFSLYAEQLQEKISLEELRQDLEKLVGHSLNKWEACQSISNVEINQYLLDKLEPITREIYLDLRLQALAISFSDYALDKDSPE